MPPRNTRWYQHSRFKDSPWLVRSRWAMFCSWRADERDGAWKGVVGTIRGRESGYHGGSCGCCQNNVIGHVKCYTKCRRKLVLPGISILRYWLSRAFPLRHRPLERAKLHSPLSATEILPTTSPPEPEKSLLQVWTTRLHKLRSQYE